MVIVTATTPQYLEQIARVALNAGSDYMDIWVRQNTIPLLKALSPEITKAGRVFITQAGFHPGLPAVFIRQGKPYFDGALNKPGVWLMGNFVDNFRLMKDMENMGIKIRVDVTNGNGK